MSEPNEPQEPQDAQPDVPAVPEPPAVVHVGPCHWRIEGRDVFLSRSAPDTEDEARRMMAEAFAHRE